MSDIYQEGHKPCQRCGVIVPWFELKPLDNWMLCNYCYQERLDEKRPRCEKCREIIYGAEVHRKGVLLCDNCAEREKAVPLEFREEPGKPVEREYREPPPWPFGQKISTPQTLPERITAKVYDGVGLFAGLLERVLVQLKIKKKIELRPMVKLKVAEKKKKKLSKQELLELMEAIEKEKKRGERKTKKEHKKFKETLDRKKDESEKTK